MVIKMKNKNLYNYIFTAFFVAIIAIFSQIAIPFGPIPLTLQTFAVALAGYTLERKYAVLSILVYLALGAVGMPVFSNFKGGISAFFGATGGFLIGFLLLVLLCTFGKGKSKIIYSLLGLILCHLCGVIWFSFILSNSIWQAFLISSLPYILKDLISLIFANFISNSIRKHISKP